MCPFVCYQVTRIAKRLVTLVAVVGLHSRVCRLCCIKPSDWLNDLSLVKKLLSRMYPFVSYQLARTTKQLFTLVAVVGLHFRMCPFGFKQGTKNIKCPITLVAVVRHSSQLCSLVFLTRDNSREERKCGYNVQTDVTIVSVGLWFVYYNHYLIPFQAFTLQFQPNYAVICYL